MAKKEIDPRKVTIYGRLSYPTFTAQEAFELSQRGNYPAASPAAAKPGFMLAVEADQLKKFRDHVENQFFPFIEQRAKEGEKSSALDAKQIALLKESIDANGSGVCNTPWKEMDDKAQETFPEAVALLKFIGNAGVDIKQMAIVRDEDELAVPDPDILRFPVLLPINETVHTMYAGCYVAVTCNLYAYTQGKLPGFSAGATTAVFKQDGDRIGGGVEVDEDEIFAD